MFIGKRCSDSWHYFTVILITSLYDLREGDTKTIRNLLAYRKVGVEGATEEFWVPPPTVFDKEFVVGVNKGELVKELERIGWLLPYFLIPILKMLKKSRETIDLYPDLLSNCQYSTD